MCVSESVHNVMYGRVCLMMTGQEVVYTMYRKRERGRSVIVAVSDSETRAGSA